MVKKVPWDRKSSSSHSSKYMHKYIHNTVAQFQGGEKEAGRQAITHKATKRPLSDLHSWMMSSSSSSSSSVQSSLSRSN